MKKTQNFQNDLLSWYEKTKRDLPWRRTEQPYAIWVSEIMLQQTQVGRVKPYYRRFLKRFPTVHKLSRTNWRSLLPYWRGLGYYRRARNLMQTARELCSKHDGRFPSSTEDLLALPGIGHYTAAAIRSFAFGHPVAAVDTNIRRVVSRIFGVSGQKADALAQKLFDATLRSGDLNHALMDIGATICTSRAPQHELCPLSGFCTFCKNRPPKKQPTRSSRVTVDIHVAAACIHRDGAVLIAKRPRRKGGEWEFPGGKKEPGEDIRACLKREIREELGIEISVRPAFATRDFNKDGKTVRLHFCRCQILRGRPRAKEHEMIQWVPLPLLHRAQLATTNRAAARLLSLSGKRTFLTQSK